MEVKTPPELVLKENDSASTVSDLNSAVSDGRSPLVISARVAITEITEFD